MTSQSTSQFPKPGSTSELEHDLVLTPKFDAEGLVAAVATDANTGVVLMLAWMNAEAMRLTIETGEAHFWSRSRRKIWKKGEDSGNVLRVSDMRVDCDQDALWLKVSVAGAGVACHTGQRTCFYRSVPLGQAAAGPVRLVPAAAE